MIQIQCIAVNLAPPLHYQHQRNLRDTIHVASACSNHQLTCALQKGLLLHKWLQKQSVYCEAQKAGLLSIQRAYRTLHNYLHS